MTLAEINLTQETAYKHNLQRMLRSIRMACGFTQDDIAATLCINRTTYTSYETGKACPDFITLVKLGTVFQIPPETFLYPEKYANLETTQQRVRHMPAMDLQKLFPEHGLAGNGRFANCPGSSNQYSILLN